MALKRAYSHADSLDRLVTVTQADKAAGCATPAEKAKTAFTYTDLGPNPQVATGQDQSTLGDQVLAARIVYDGMGRKKQAIGTDGRIVDYDYDGLSRVSGVSNPRASGDTPVMTTTEYDGLGRVVKVTQPGGAITTTSYAANETTVTDPASVTRKVYADGLGRLTQVKEANTIRYLLSLQRPQRPGEGVPRRSVQYRRHVPQCRVGPLVRLRFAEPADQREQP